MKVTGVSGRFFLPLFVAGFLLFAGFLSAQEGYISARGFAESQGIAYQWFPIQKLLVMRKGLRTVKLTVNSNVAMVDDQQLPMPAPAKIISGQIMVPATALTRFFQVSSVENLNTPPPVPIATTPVPKVIQPTSATETQQKPSEEDEAILVALRHSVRDDHTRIVLEFNDQITYKSDFTDGLYRLTIMGCRNLIPTQRSNPVGRDIKKLDINSGSDRKGLILSFQLNQKIHQPTIETVASPFRMVISFPLSDLPQTVATETSNVQTEQEKQSQLPIDNINKNTSEPPTEEIPDINITVEAAQLNNPEFKGRVVVIDPGHGGTDKGFVIDGRPAEKDINLIVAEHLKSSLEERGLRAVLIRTDDREMSLFQRISMANKNGGDLFISLHTGGSYDKSKAGFAVFTFEHEGTHFEETSQGLSYDAVYGEWLKTTRFDLAKFFAKKVIERLSQHIQSKSRGHQRLPLSQLKMIVNPAILVEVGMLSDSIEGKNLTSDNYRKAIAQSIANAVVDFFNGIVINP